MSIKVIVLIFAFMLAGCASQKKAGTPPVSETTSRGEEPVRSRKVVPAVEQPAPEPIIHVVKEGENLSLIAKKYGVTVKAISEANNITNPNFIRINQKLIIPEPGIR